LKVHEISSNDEDFLYMYDFSDDGQVMESIKTNKMLDNIKTMMIEYGND
jgi:hypothetical protein